jgi:gluconolactonase
MPSAEVVAIGLGFCEGPVWCPDGTVVCTSVSHGALFRVLPPTGLTTLVADIGGGANAAAPAGDGGFLVTQNGGVDFAAVGHDIDAPPMRPRTPGLVRTLPDGSSEYLTEEPMQAPNDVVVASDGTVLFTDPGPYRPRTGHSARLVAYTPGGATLIVADGLDYLNGIAFDLDDETLVVVESEGLMRMADCGRGERMVFAGPWESGADGLCVDVEGRCYVASKPANGIRVVDPDGTELDFLPVDDGHGFVTNCCFGGDDGRTLFATETHGGRLVAWEGMPDAGLPIHTWPVP